MSQEILTDPGEDPDENYIMRITRKDGSRFEADLGKGYRMSQVRLELYGEGVVVRHPGKDPVYVNGNTSQVSHNPEVCRSALILAVGADDIGRIKKRGLH